VTISGLEMIQNSGKEAIIDLLDGRMEVAEAQLANRIGSDIYGDGTGNAGKNIDGLAAAVPDAPTSGTYGGINRANWSFWQFGVVQRLDRWRRCGLGLQHPAVHGQRGCAADSRNRQA
jgi:hypothetical protein